MSKKLNRRRREILKAAARQNPAPITLSGFFLGVAKIAKQYGRDYFTATAVITHNRYGRESVLRFQAYIDGGDSAMGVTPARALELLADSWANKGLPQLEVVIEEEPPVIGPVVAAPHPSLTPSDDLPF